MSLKLKENCDVFWSNFYEVIGLERLLNEIPIFLLKSDYADWNWASKFEEDIEGKEVYGILTFLI